MRAGKYESSDKSTVGTAVTFLLVGLGAGALIALLFAPKSGKQLRRDIRRKYEDAREAVEDLTDQARERVEDAADWVEDVKESAREKVAPLNRAFRGK